MRSEHRHDPDAEYDTTSCRHNNYRYTPHRDYMAHCMRWGWATNFVDDTTTVLEPGCGIDSPLYQVLKRPRGSCWRPKQYVGVDLNKIAALKTKRHDTALGRSMVLLEDFNFVERWRELQKRWKAFDLAVSFEVIEHMTERHGDEYLSAIHALLRPGGKLLLSTPVFDGSAAKNHIREYTVAELGAKLDACGFEVADRFGTFASWSAVKRGLREVMPEPEARVLLRSLERARGFYGAEVLSCYLAPLLPDHSRNNAWVAVKKAKRRPSRR
jgi:SAM-dependent methyltransferase